MPALITSGPLVRIYNVFDLVVILILFYTSTSTTLTSPPAPLSSHPQRLRNHVANVPNRGARKEDRGAHNEERLLDEDLDEACPCSRISFS